LTILAFVPTTLPYLCLALFGCSAGSLGESLHDIWVFYFILGFTTGGFFKAGPLVSKHYSHFVTGNISLGMNEFHLRDNSFFRYYRDYVNRSIYC
jgi:hypothetical protein